MSLNSILLEKFLLSVLTFNEILDSFSNAAYCFTICYVTATTVLMETKYYKVTQIEYKIIQSLFTNVYFRMQSTTMTMRWR